jgi:tRNA dimethylallyltransferase
MVDAGLEDEVRRLLARGYAPTLPALQGIGYRQFVQVVAGTLSRNDALRLMQRDTVRYAKRQWTWFQREPGIEWIDVVAAGGPDGVAAAIAARLAQGGGIE